MTILYMKSCYNILKMSVGIEGTFERMMKTTMNVSAYSTCSGSFPEICLVFVVISGAWDPGLLTVCEDLIQVDYTV